MSRILLIENDETQLNLLSQFISAWGYSVIKSRTVVEAMGTIHREEVDLALIDLLLPDTPGIEALKMIRETENLREIPVFMMAEEISPEVRIVVMSNGANDLLIKPIDQGELSMKIQQSLELSRYKKEISALNKKLEKDKKSLLRYFSEDLVEKILNEEISNELGGTIVNTSIMFFDIRGSTTLAEKIGPQEYAAAISEIFSDLMNIIFNHSGSVNELLGDGILATFGCPFPKDDDAANAIKTAIAMQKHIAAVNEGRKMAGRDEIRFGIGIATGKIFAGNIGSIRMMKYAVMGDPVNTAARIQDLTKELPYQIIVDQATRDHADQKIRFAELPQTNLRGKSENVKLFGILNE